MSRTTMDLSVSLDGYAAGSNISPKNPMGDNGERLHDRMFVDPGVTHFYLSPSRDRSH
jgi:hypothetical protein